MRLFGLASDPARLVDEVNMRLLGGGASAQMRTSLIQAVTAVPAHEPQAPHPTGDLPGRDLVASSRSRGSRSQRITRVGNSFAQRPHGRRSRRHRHRSRPPRHGQRAGRAHGLQGPGLRLPERGQRSTTPSCRWRPPAPSTTRVRGRPGPERPRHSDTEPSAPRFAHPGPACGTQRSACTRASDLLRPRPRRRRCTGFGGSGSSRWSRTWGHSWSR
jgi:hypothetical protein